MVMANCLYICPAKPPKKATGTKTEQSTSTMATTGPVTSCMVLIVASLTLTPSSSMIRSTFSKTTMASSTTMPMARTRPNKVKVLMVKPSRYMPANVPTMETGTARHGMRVARHFCKKMKTTQKTSTIASKSVWITSWIETSTNVVISKGMEYATPSGKFSASSSMVLRTSFAVSNALAPGARYTAIGWQGLPFSLEERL